MAQPGNQAAADRNGLNRERAANRFLTHLPKHVESVRLQFFADYFRCAAPLTRFLASSYTMLLSTRPWELTWMEPFPCVTARYSGVIRLDRRSRAFAS